MMIRYGVDAPTKTAFARDVSERGLQLQTNSVMQPGTTLQVQLKFPDRTFTLWARVAWAKKVPPQLAYTLHCGMGLEFMDPDPEWPTYYRDVLAGGG